MKLIELMRMHRRIFQIKESMHDLMCRGSKDYRTSLLEVNSYNMTKHLAMKSCIPDENGNLKNSEVEFNIMKALFEDIATYNHVDLMMRKMRLGLFRDEVQGIENGDPIVEPREVNQ